MGVVRAITEIEVRPSAAALIESMRDFGYSLETALADIIDNSITADSRNIDIITSEADGKMRIGVIDDGKGMTFDELIAAMPPGSRSPLDERSVSDLGRFGLGLKTASFSQCRRVTIVTRRSGHTSAACWDLDFVRKRDAWIVQVPASADEIPFADRIGSKGTLVLWEQLDRFVGSSGQADDSDHGAYLNRRISEAADHLELVFHRFLAGEPGRKKVSISLNSRPLVPLDPFNSSHPSTQASPEERIHVEGQSITVQAFTLPHFAMVSQDEWNRYGMVGGYLKNQGFYVYRQRRLIIHGTWFGIVRQKANTQLARVRIDISNSLDSTWKIDVRKASAELPYPVRRRLKSIIDDIGDRARRPFEGRGVRRMAANRLPVWHRIQDDKSITYRVNIEHPLLEQFSDSLDPAQRQQFVRLLEFVGSALPIDPLYSDLGMDPEKVEGQAATRLTLEEAVHAIVRSLRAGELTDEQIRGVLRLADPFRLSWDLTSEILDETLKGSTDV